MSQPELPTSSEPLPEAELPGPYPVGRYAAKLRAKLRTFANVQLVGEVANLRAPTPREALATPGAARHSGGRRTRAYFELRDRDGAVPCAMWRDDWDRLGPTGASLADGVEVVVSGGCDYYPGSASASPAFSFTVRSLRVAGEGDLLAQIERRRRALAADGLLERQRALPRTALPRTIGIVCAQSGKAGEDLVAALQRRGWRGRVVWAFAPVQDRHAASRIAAALQDLSSSGSVEVIVVARGGGSLTDLLALSDEMLCRTVALLPVPVIASIGHHTDHTLLDDVAAVSCSTPTHAAEAAVPLDCNTARGALAASARRLAHHSHAAVLTRARLLAALSRAPVEHLARERAGLRQATRELRAAARRQLGRERAGTLTRARALAQHRAAFARECQRRRPAEFEQLRLALMAHDPERTLARGYALAEDTSGEPLTSAAAARAAGHVTLRFADGRVGAQIESG